MQLFHCQSSVLVSLRCHHECVGKSEPEPNNQILSVTKERCISVQALTLLLAVTVNTVSSIPTNPLAHREAQPQPMKSMRQVTCWIGILLGSWSIDHKNNQFQATTLLTWRWSPRMATSRHTSVQSRRDRIRLQGGSFPSTTELVAWAPRSVCQLARNLTLCSTALLAKSWIPLSDLKHWR